MSNTTADVDFGPDPRARARKAVVAASLGNAPEWFGVTLLGGFASTVLAWLVTYDLRAPSFYYIALALL